MLVTKNSKFWSDIILISSIVCVIFMSLSLIDTRQEWFTTRDAATYMRYGVLAGVFIMAASLVIILLVRNNTQALVKSFSALSIITISLLTVKAYLPLGSNLFSEQKIKPTALRPNTSHPPLALALVSIKQLSSKSITPPKQSVLYRPENNKITQPVKHHSIATELATHFSEINAINSSLSE